MIPSARQAAQRSATAHPGLGTAVKGQTAPGQSEAAPPAQPARDGSLQHVAAAIQRSNVHCAQPMAQQLRQTSAAAAAAAAAPAASASAAGLHASPAAARRTRVLPLEPPRHLLVPRHGPQVAAAAAAGHAVQAVCGGHLGNGGHPLLAHPLIQPLVDCRKGARGGGGEGGARANCAQLQRNWRARKAASATPLAWTKRRPAVAPATTVCTRQGVQQQGRLTKRGSNSKQRHSSDAAAAVAQHRASHSR